MSHTPHREAKGHAVVNVPYPTQYGLPTIRPHDNLRGKQESTHPTTTRRPSCAQTVVMGKRHAQYHHEEHVMLINQAPPQREPDAESRTTAQRGARDAIRQPSWASAWLRATHGTTMRRTPCGATTPSHHEKHALPTTWVSSPCHRGRRAPYRKRGARDAEQPPRPITRSTPCQHPWCRHHATGDNMSRTANEAQTRCAANTLVVVTLTARTERTRSRKRGSTPCQRS